MKQIRGGERGLHSRLTRRVRPRLEGQKRTPLSCRVATGTVFSRRRPEEVPCPSGRVLRKNGSASLARRHNTAIEAREKSLRKAGPAPPAGSRTLQVTFACTALIVNSIPDMESDKESVPCSEFKCTRFNKAVAYDPTSPPQLGLTHNLSSNTKRR